MRALSSKELRLPLPWFRRKNTSEEQAPVQAAAPVAAPDPVVRETASPAGPHDPTRPKRRRGTRGGRGRKKPGETTAAGAAPKAERPEKAEPKPRERKKPAERRSSSSQTRRRTPPKRAPLPKAKRELLVSVDVGEKRVAMLEDDRVAEVYLERPERRSIAGNIYKGQVDNVLPGMEAAFVEIGLEKNGFLYVDEIVTPELEGRRHGRKIQDLIAKGEEILVQAVKDPMKTKGARLTTEISLPGRFVVYVPQGEGLGVSRRLEDDERNRLKAILKEIAPADGGVIVRTAAEGASAEDIERDLEFVQRLWKSIEAQAKQSKAPALVYQEAELPLRVIRDLFTGDFERALVDDDRTLKRIVGYLKKTSPHMVDRVSRYREKTPMFDEFGVADEIRSTLNRRVDLPSGGYLVFDYAEAFTVIDVNTGRFVGSRSKNSGARLEDTITKNNLEAVKEVVRQLRLRDVGGIIVIDFIDMASPKNRAAVEQALGEELERDRTKTYVVEISPLGLVEMTRQNVTDGPREILTKKCPTCGGDGIVVSEATAAVDVERRLRALVTPGSRVKAFKVELNAKIASLVAGPGGSRLAEIEEASKRSFFLVGKEDVHLDHFNVLDQGTIEKLAPQGAPVEEGKKLEVKLVELARHDGAAGSAKLEGYEICVGDAAKLVGKKVKIEITRVLEGIAYAKLVETGAKAPSGPLTAEAEAEKPTRAKRAPAKKAGDAEPEAEAVEDEAEPADAEAPEEEEQEAPAVDGEAPKRKTRRGSRGGRNRNKKPAVAGAESAPEANGDGDAADAVEVVGAAAAAPKIHVPERELGAESENGEPPAPRKKTRRGSRGGKNRKKNPVAVGGADAEATEPDAAPEVVTEDKPTDDWEYVPMSQWDDDSPSTDRS